MNVIVKLDVGGCLYTTKRSTLTRYPDSMLAAMFSGELDPSIRDANGAYFIDRDGPIFRHVLNFLRQGRLVLPEDFKELDQLELEADFYQVKALVRAVNREKCRVVITKDSAKDRKFEFIEIEQGDDMYIVKYIGSSETLANLPGLLQILISFLIYSGTTILDIVKEKGMYETRMQYYSKSKSAALTPNCLSIFREILNHGFELKMEHGTKWTFLRKI